MSQKAEGAFKLFCFLKKSQLTTNMGVFIHLRGSLQLPNGNI